MATRKLYEGMVHFRTIEGRVVVFPGPDPVRSGGTRWTKVKSSATSSSGVAVVGKTKSMPAGAFKMVPKPTAKVSSLRSFQTKAGQWRSKGNVPATASSRASGASGTKAGTKASLKLKPATAAPKAVKPSPAPKPKAEPKPKPEPKVKPNLPSLKPSPEGTIY